MKYKVIVFDADGVLFPSTPVKKDSWYMLRSFPGFGEAHVLRAKGELSDKALSRYEILDVLFRDHGVLDEAARRQSVETYADLYGRLVSAGLSVMSVEEGVRSTLSNLASSGIPLYVNTATPEEEIARTLDRFAIGSFFKGAYGKPSSKGKNFQRVMTKEVVGPGEILYVGDEWRDFNAAEETGTQFVALNVPWTDWSGATFPVLQKFSELLTFVR